ncbi:MAG: hypothetical protein ACLQU3_12560 [Limisphaerales bacterium]
MKNIWLSSREIDRRILSVLLCAGLPGLIGFCLEPPALDEWPHLRLFDAAVFSLLGLGVWGAFHLFGFHRLSGRRAVAMIIAFSVV